MDAPEEIILRPSYLYHGAIFLLFSYMFLASGTFRFQIIGSTAMDSLSILVRLLFPKNTNSSLPLLLIQSKLNIVHQIWPMVLFNILTPVDEAFFKSTEYDKLCTSTLSLNIQIGLVGFPLFISCVLRR